MGRKASIPFLFLHIRNLTNFFIWPSVFPFFRFEETLSNTIFLEYSNTNMYTILLCNFLIVFDIKLIRQRRTKRHVSLSFYSLFFIFTSTVLDHRRQHITVEKSQITFWKETTSHRLIFYKSSESLFLKNQHFFFCFPPRVQYDTQHTILLQFS